jgi:HPt (histidine-containing phosphotransfer) domain-containing protein
MKELDREIFDQDIIDEFMSEFRENIESAMHHILLLEKDPDDTGSLHDLFRNFHSIKGNASFVGFERIHRLCHETENLLGNIREHTIEINAQIIETLLMSTDALTALVDEVEGRASFDVQKLNALINTISRYLPPEALPNAPLALCLQIVTEASQIFDQTLSLAMSGRFDSALPDIREKATKLSECIKDALCPGASKLLTIFQDYMTVIRTHSLPFSEFNFGLFKNLFLAFIDTLLVEIAVLLKIRLVTLADLYRQEGAIPWHESFGKGAGVSPLYTIIDLSGNEDMDRETTVRVESAVQNLCKASRVVAFIDPFKRSINVPDRRSFDSSLEALDHIIQEIEREQRVDLMI